MKNIGLVILAVCLATLGSMAAYAQVNNTAYGSGALQSDINGGYNAAFGVDSLFSNNGWLNTAIGYGALISNTTANYNTATGSYSLYSNVNGGNDTATGSLSLVSNVTGYDNTANGFMSLYYNTQGSYNTATGEDALFNSTIGDYNTAVGINALFSNTTASYNTAVGDLALYSNTSGGSNIGIGHWAGYYNPAGVSNNIDIGNIGSGIDNSSTIRIGTPGTQTAFFVAGVRGTRTGAKDAIEVMIDENGQLGTVNSSIRFKEDVHDMAAASDGLMRLRPVTYRYKQPYADGSKPIDYGLIAEEVAEVYPDLVAKDADGQIQTVQYQKLTPMLLNEVQKERRLLEQQQQTIEQQAETIQRQEQSVERQEKSAAQQAETIQRLEKRLAALESALPSATMLETRLVTK
jgi:polyhydroxyalkanoate synthesis regulator phasin